MISLKEISGGGSGRTPSSLVLRALGSTTQPLMPRFGKILGSVSQAHTLTTILDVTSRSAASFIALGVVGTTTRISITELIVTINGQVVPVSGVGASIGSGIIGLLLGNVVITSSSTVVNSTTTSSKENVFATGVTMDFDTLKIQVKHDSNHQVALYSDLEMVQ